MSNFKMEHIVLFRIKLPTIPYYIQKQLLIYRLLLKKQ